MRKKSKNGVMAAFLMSILTLSCGLMLTGCDSGDSIKATQAGPGVYDILKRHDAYVTADTTLTPTQKEIYLRTSALVKKTFDTALAPKSTSTSTSTSTGVSISTLPQSDYEKMEAVQRFAFTFAKKDCKQNGKKLTYEEFAANGPHVCTKQMADVDLLYVKPGSECESCVGLQKNDGKLEWVIFDDTKEGELLPPPRDAVTVIGDNAGLPPKFNTKF